MYSTPLPNARLSPLSVGLIIGGALLFVVVVIVRQVTTPSMGIDAATAAGLASIGVPNAQSNIGNALPAFAPINVSANAQPLPTAHPEIVFQSADELAAWDNPTWLSVAYDPSNTRWVWAGAWFSCRHLDPVAFTYATIRTDEALAVWGGLAPRKQHEVLQECVR
jgi:hypothetical protein